MTTSATNGAMLAHENRGSFAVEGSIGERAARVGSALRNGLGALRGASSEKAGTEH